MSGIEGPDRSRPSTAFGAGSRRAAMRVVQDADAIMLVYEFESGLRAAGVPATLVFERGGTRRELAQYPPEWRRMSDAQLVQLLERARGD